MPHPSLPLMALASRGSVPWAIYRPTPSGHQACAPDKRARANRRRAQDDPQQATAPARAQGLVGVALLHPVQSPTSSQVSLEAQAAAVARPVALEGALAEALSERRGTAGPEAGQAAALLMLVRAREAAGAEAQRPAIPRAERAMQG